jgi:hypothetical protein
MTHTMIHTVLQLPGITQRERMATALMPKLHPGWIPVGVLRELSGKAFQTRFWREAKFQYFELTKVHRQKNQEFVARLREVREGRVTPGGLEFWSNLERNLPASHVEPTHLYARNVEVDGINKSKLEELEAATEHRYECVDSVEAVHGAPAWAEDKLWKDDDFFENNSLVPKVLILRKGAQVILSHHQPGSDHAFWPAKLLVT